MNRDEPDVDKAPGAAGSQYTEITEELVGEERDWESNG